MVIQAILRHTNMQVTLEHYVRMREHRAVAAMQAFDHAVTLTARSQAVNRAVYMQPVCNRSQTTSSSLAVSD